MFSSDHKIADLVKLVHETRDYVNQRLEVGRFDLTAKLIALLSALCLGVVLLIIVAACLLFLSLSLVEVLDGVVRSRAAAYLIVGALYLLLALLCYVLRKPLIYDTMANFIGHLFLDGHPKEKEEKA